jgi:hypothetical protein
MPTVTFTWGHIGDGLEVLSNVQSPRPPFQRGACIIAYELVEGTDFDDGDTVVIEIPGIDTIQFASVVSAEGAAIAFAEAADSSGTGKKLTLTAPDANLKVFIITDT